MNSRRLLAAGALCALTVGLSAQTGRTLTISTAARLGGTLGILMQHPPSAAGNYYEALWSAPTLGAINVGFPFVQGLLRLDVSNFAMLYNGVLSPSGRRCSPTPSRRTWRCST